jgi:hypothetical protein
MSLYDLRAASVVARNTGSASPRHALAASPTTMTSTRTACTSTPVAASLGLVNRLARAEQWHYPNTWCCALYLVSA